MQSNTDTDSAQGGAQNTPDLAEGYPTLTKVLRAISNIENVPDKGVRRIEVNCFASGDATFNVFHVDAEEAVGGYFTTEDLS
jgi:hypothetical protein